MTNPAQISGESSLKGLRVIEIGTSVAAPYGAQILGDFGAEVIKVERLGGGDDSRNWAPPDWGGKSISFLTFNRNKKSVVLDYKTEQGRKILEDLISSADVLIQNLRPGSLANAGFSPERLRELNPRLIYCEMSGYGHTGPRALQPAYDPLLQAYSGIVSITGEDGGPPARVPISMLDMGTGMWTALAVYEALRRRDVSGTGVHIQLSLLQTALTWMSAPLMGVDAGYPAPRRLGSGFRGNVPSGAFPTSDGYVFLSVGNNDTWYRLLDALDAQELRDLPGYSDNRDRVTNRDVVNAGLSEHTSRFTLAEILERLKPSKVPHAAVSTADQVLTDEQVVAIGQITPMELKGAEDFRVVNLPMTFDGQYPPLQTAPPSLGADTVQVLASLGLGQEEIDGLLAEGVIEGTEELVTSQKAGQA